jgi:hypothetical protein
VTYAGAFGLPQSGGLIIVRPGVAPLRASSIVVDTGHAAARSEDRDMRSLLREVIAIRKAGAKK